MRRRRGGLSLCAPASASDLVTQLRPRVLEPARVIAPASSVDHDGVAFGDVVGQDSGCNAHVSGRWLDAHTRIDSDARTMLVRAAERLSLSARGYHRVIKVARTIADLDGTSAITEPSIAEALRYRPASAVEETPSSLIPA